MLEQEIHAHSITQVLAVIPKRLKSRGKDGHLILRGARNTIIEVSHFIKPCMQVPYTVGPGLDPPIR